MKFQITPEEAQPVAIVAAKHFRKTRMQVRIETAAWQDAPYTTTLLAARSTFSLLIEAQGSLSYGTALREFARWMFARQHYCELYLAVTSEATLVAGVLGDIKSDGVGLMVINENKQIQIQQKARNPALMVRPDPTLRFGDRKDEVHRCVTKFNDVDRKDGLRDLCELVERETEALALRAVNAGWLTMDEPAVRAMDWSTRINMLASPKSYNGGRAPILEQPLKDDLHSFRGARNLVDHNVASKREEARRQRQFAERMFQGPRLMAELFALRRKVR